MKLDNELRVAHIADIHYRGLSRHDEYREVSTHFFKKCKELKVDKIFIGGDIFHTKTQGISPEVIEELTWFFRTSGDTAETHVILGNHDLNLTNKKRQDAISPIISALNHDNVHLYKHSGVYDFAKDVKLCVYSCVDEDAWPNVKPDKDSINVAAFHGCVVGSVTDSDWELDGEVKLSFFDGYDFIMLGDIHKHQFLDKENRCAYPGSMVQQNYGEDLEKGFLLWSIRGDEDFDVKFHALPNPKPYVTIDWHDTVAKTLKQASKHPVGSRFRVKTGKVISQHDIKQLYSDLKTNRKAEEIVLKNDAKYHDADIGLSKDDDTIKSDLRSVEAHQKLFEEYLKLTDTKLNADETKEIQALIKAYVTTINADSEDLRNIKWTLNKLEFSNLFSYGKGNVIDFTKLSGITGIFGPNRLGKSSIPGAIMYALWNSSDRGSLKNLYMINNRKGSCRARAIVTVSGNEYVIDRSTSRYTAKNGTEHGVTSLDFGAYDPFTKGVAADCSLKGLARQDTDKKIKRFVGNSDDFLMTSFASQGALNQFIKAGATQRKAYLSKFLGLEVFDRMNELSKKKIIELKAQLKVVPEESWIPRITKLVEQRQGAQDIIKDTAEQITKKRKALSTLNADIAQWGGSLYAYSDLQDAQQKVWNAENRIGRLNESIRKFGLDIVSQTDEIEALTLQLEEFDPDTLREFINELRSLRALMNTKEQSLRHENATLSRLMKSESNLSDIPCGDSFPKCKFIKDSVVDKQRIPEQAERCENIEEEISQLTVLIEDKESHNYEEQLADYRRIKAKVEKLKGTSSTLQLRTAKLEVDVANAESELSTAEALFDEIKQICQNTDELKRAEETRAVYERQLKELDAMRIKAARVLGHADTELKRMKEDHENFKKKGKALRLYEIFHTATSKKGIPTLVLRRLAPAINAEIAKILAGVVDFTIEIEPSELSSSIDIFINYGDSKRVIEVASGMEKMISSLTLRVALINISSLPKTDLFIIDEGFGALDETNVEACNKLLVSLKRWFRNILVITHIDVIKDVVDNMFEITKDGKDSHIEYI